MSLSAMPIAKRMLFFTKLCSLIKYYNNVHQLRTHNAAAVLIKCNRHSVHFEDRTRRLKDFLKPGNTVIIFLQICLSQCHLLPHP